MTTTTITEPIQPASKTATHTLYVELVPRASLHKGTADMTLTQKQLDSLKRLRQQTGNAAKYSPQRAAQILAGQGLADRQDDDDDDDGPDLFGPDDYSLAQRLNMLAESLGLPATASMSEIKAAATRLVSLKGSAPRPAASGALTPAQVASCKRLGIDPKAAAAKLRSIGMPDKYAKGVGGPVGAMLDDQPGASATPSDGSADAGGAMQKIKSILGLEANASPDAVIQKISALITGALSPQQLSSARRMRIPIADAVTKLRAAAPRAPRV